MDKEKTIFQRFAGKGLFPPQMAFTLLIPVRAFTLSPGRLIKRMDLKKDQTVLEIGPGPGYYSIDVAKALSDGKLYLFDIQQEMLDHARKRLEKRGQFNVQYCRADGATFPFHDKMFDRMFMVTVIGEVENREAYVREMARTLKDDGVVSVSELAGDPDMLKVDEVKAILKPAGLECSREYRAMWGYTLNFTKR